MEQLISIIAGIFGIMTGIYFLWVLYRKRVPKKISWRKIEKGVLKIIEHMRRDNFTPDIVICIGRSGAILGGLLAGNMKNLPIALMDRKFQWDESSRQFVLSDFSHIKLDPHCRKVLIVIGEVYSGQSMLESIKILKPQLREREYKTTCLVQSAPAPFRTDYYAFLVTKTKRPAWVITKDYVRYEKIK